MRFRGIDVSEFQGIIDWDRVKTSGIECVIVRYGDPAHSNYEDVYFRSNMRECEKRGFHLGAYILSRATTAKAARLEARNMISACKSYKYDMPLYIDLEIASCRPYVNDVIAGFLAECDSAGVIGGVYANQDWFSNSINTEKIKDRPLWIAQYNERITHKRPEYFGAWQYTSVGRVPGISGNCDLDYFYIDYWNKEKPAPAPDPEYTDSEKIKAIDVLLGKYGAGDERVKKLGKDYKKVQSLVNDILERLGV